MQRTRGSMGKQMHKQMITKYFQGVVFSGKWEYHQVVDAVYTCWLLGQGNHIARDSIYIQIQEQKYVPFAHAFGIIIYALCMRALNSAVGNLSINADAEVSCFIDGEIST